MFLNTKLAELERLGREKDKKFTITKLLKYVPLTMRAYNAIKSGLNKPKVETLEKIAKFYGVDMNYFFNMENVSKSEITEDKIKPDATEYLFKRYEEVVAEMALLKSELAEYRKKCKCKENTGKEE